MQDAAQHAQDFTSLLYTWFQGTSNSVRFFTLLLIKGRAVMTPLADFQASYADFFLLS